MRTLKSLSLQLILLQVVYSYTIQNSVIKFVSIVHLQTEGYFFWPGVIDFYRKIKLEPFRFPMGLLVAQALIYSMHNGHLGDYPFFWMILGMMAGSKCRIDKDVSESYS